MVYETEFASMMKLARECGGVAMEYFQKIPAGKPRDATNGLLHEADKKIDALMVNTYEREFPGSALATEESPPRAGERYMIAGDPIDGTTNYTFGIRDFVNQQALFDGPMPVVAIIFDPANGAMYHAIRGQGAYLNGNRIKVSNRDVRQALVILANDYLFPKMRRRGIDLIKFLTEEVNPGTQRTFRQRIAEGGNRLSFVAAGHYDGFVGENMKIWDIAPGALLVGEAGGSSTDFDGHEYASGAKDLAATNGIIHDDMLRYLQFARR